MVKKINVRSFDFDGCLFNQRYIDLAGKEKRLEVANQDFLRRITKSMQSTKHGKFSQIILMVGSNRQSKSVDELNSYTFSAGGPARIKESCFSASNQLKQLIEERITIPCCLDKYLLADTYSDMPDGANFEKAVRGEKDGFGEWLFDASKLSILYAQMHKIASENPKAHITFDFYDDRKGILDGLSHFFRQNPLVMPKNLYLRLHHYDGGDITNYKIIKGRGEIDFNYAANVLLMAQLAGCDFDKDASRKNNFIALLDGRNKVAQFVVDRQVKKGKSLSVIRRGVAKASAEGMFGVALKSTALKEGLAIVQQQDSVKKPPTN